jgi:Na+/H+-translocating membrane pyrophosphatase
MFIAYIASLQGLGEIMDYPSIFAFGLVAFGFLGMGPVTIAVDSYGPVTDNAQSIYELSLIETIPDIDKEIEKDFGFKPDFETGKDYLEKNDGAGNTFTATAKPVLIGTAVVGATTMIFSLILVIKNVLGVAPETILNLLNPYTILGFICGGAVIYWFTGASTQAVSTGAYRAVDYIKRNIQLDENASQKAATEKSKEVVKICTQYAQKGMLNIFIAIFSFALAFAFISAPSGKNEPVAFFVAYLISIAVFGLFQAIFMANAGGCWDNAKKVVEVDLKEKGTAIVFISHKLSEIFSICDRISVLRDGNSIGTVETAECSEEALIQMMVGREIKEIFPKTESKIGEVILEVKNLTSAAVKNVSFSLKKGEILGFSGLVGAGRTEMALALFGIDRIHSGEVYIDGKGRYQTP